MRTHPLASDCDDDNDTLLFQMLQEYVLTHYPNPDRIGCLDEQTLEAFVYAPETLELSDIKFLHVFKCAECTRVLMHHREMKARDSSHLTVSVDANKGKTQRNYIRAVTAILLLLCCLVVA